MQLVQLCENEWVFSDPSITMDIDEMFDNALEADDRGDLKTAKRMAYEILRKCPNHIDALHHLSLWTEEGGDKVAAYAFCQAAVGIGLHAIPTEFRWGRSRLLWIELPNRPFLRAYRALAIHRMKQQTWDEAIAILARLLAVNPNDNQGCRHLLPDCWFEVGDAASVIDHCNLHSDDVSPFILYSSALAHILAQGPSESRVALERAVRERPLVAKELLATSHPKPDTRIPRTDTIGGSEAWKYWNRHDKYWKRCKPALPLLNDVAETQGLSD